MIGCRIDLFAIQLIIGIEDINTNVDISILGEYFILLKLPPTSSSLLLFFFFSAFFVDDGSYEIDLTIL